MNFDCSLNSKDFVEHVFVNSFCIIHSSSKIQGPPRRRHGGAVQRSGSVQLLANRKFPSFSCFVQVDHQDSTMIGRCVAQWFQDAKTCQKQIHFSFSVTSQVFQRNFQSFRFRQRDEFHVQNLSNFSRHVSMIRQFHRLFRFNFWRVFAVWPNFALPQQLCDEKDMFD